MNCYQISYKLHALYVLSVTIVLFGGCATTGGIMGVKSDSDTNYLPKASDDAHRVIQLISNTSQTTFYVDGKKVVTGKRAKILINDRPHTITASPDGYITKEEYIQPPYDKDTYLRFTFMIADKITEPTDETDQTDRKLKQNTIDNSVNEQKPIDIAFNIPQTEGVNEDAIAVVIGNKSYSGDVPDVDFAINDASLVKKYLKNTFGVKPGNIIYRENAGKATLDAIFGDKDNYKGMLYNYVKPGESDVFIYYSGHGAPDVNSNSAYLMPVDSDPSFLSFSGYKVDVLYKNLEKLKARSVAVFLDACFSGASGDGDMLIDNASPIGIQIQSPALTVNNSLILTASNGDQVSSWYPEKRHGLFTYFLLKGFKGRADLNEDDTVTLDELRSYLTDNNNGIPYYARRLHNRIQTPSFLINGYEKELIRYE